MENVTRLPTAAETYLTVRKARGGWAVVLATPVGRETQRTALLWAADREIAVAKGREVAARMQRPFKARGANV